MKNNIVKDLSDNFYFTLLFFFLLFLFYYFLIIKSNRAFRKSNKNAARYHYIQIVMRMVCYSISENFG